MAMLDQRVDRLEETLTRFISHTDRFIEETKRESAEMRLSIARSWERIERLSAEVKEQSARFSEEMKEQAARFAEEKKRSDEEWKQETAKWHREMARISDRVGRFAEDIVAPNIPRLAREVFGLTRFEFYGERIRREHPSDPSRAREFDFLVAGDRKLVIVETKSTARLEYINSFASGLSEVYEYFPEYNGWDLIPIFASMSLSPDFVRRLTHLRIYALALGSETMELLNLEEVRRIGSGA